MRRQIRRRAVDEARAVGQRNFEATERRDEPVARRLAHRLLACPIAKESLASSAQIETCESRALVCGQEFPCEAIHAHFAITALDVDTDARPGFESACDSD